MREHKQNSCRYSALKELEPNFWLLQGGLLFLPRVKCGGWAGDRELPYHLSMRKIPVQRHSTKCLTSNPQSY